MAHTLKVKSVETKYAQASNNYFIDVEVEVYDGEELVETRRFGYPTTTTVELIQEDLIKVGKALDSDKEIASKSASLEAELSNAELIKVQLMSK